MPSAGNGDRDRSNDNTERRGEQITEFPSAVFCQFSKYNSIRDFTVKPAFSKRVAISSQCEIEEPGLKEEVEERGKSPLFMQIRLNERSISFAMLGRVILAILHE